MNCDLNEAILEDSYLKALLDKKVTLLSNETPAYLIDTDVTLCSNIEIMKIVSNIDSLMESRVLQIKKNFLKK
jgi:hypothetical protein